MTLLVCTGIAHSGWEDIVEYLTDSGLSMFPAGDLKTSLDESMNRIEGSGDNEDAIPGLVEKALLSANTGCYLYAHPGLRNALYRLPGNDPTFMSLLFYCPPEHALRCLEACESISEDTARDAMGDWMTCTQNMLEFSRSQAHQCMLVNVEDALRSPERLLRHISQMLGEALQPTREIRETGNFNIGLLDHIARYVCQGIPEAEEQYLDTKLQSTLLGSLTELNQYEAAGKDSSPVELWNQFKFESLQIIDSLKHSQQSQKSIEDRNKHLQSRIEALENQTAELSTRVKEKTCNELAFIADNQALEGQLHKIQLELETHVSDSHDRSGITSLQIKQLQEELEYYFRQFIRHEEEQKIRSSLMPLPIPLADFSSYRLDNFRDFGGEMHIDVQLENPARDSLILAPNLSLKLICSQDRVGLDMRPDPVTADLFSWALGTEDEHGRHISVIFPPDENQRGDSVWNQLPTADRLLITAIVAKLNSRLAHPELESAKYPHNPGQIRRLRHGLASLSRCLAAATDHLSVDSVALVEEHQSEGYEHLWIRLENLLCGDHYFNFYDFKLSLHDPSDTAPFADGISLEFRELENEQAPFDCWPPETVDKHGPFLHVELPETETGARHENLLLTASDQKLLEQIINKLPLWIRTLSETTQLSGRPWADWIIIAEQTSNSRQLAGDDVCGGDSVTAPELQPLISFAEHFVQPGYAHLAFKLASELGQLEFKLQAIDLEPELSLALPAIEIRRGNAKTLPFENSKLLQSDKYGDFIRFTADSLEKRATRRAMSKASTHDRAVLMRIMNELPSELDGLSFEFGDDFPAKPFWQNLSNQLSQQLQQLAP